MARWGHTVVVTPGDEVAGRYRLEEMHGRGPMSEVWRAHDDTLDRTVALKILAPTADLERFRREARAVASLGHENVMRVYDYGEDARGPFMALEWLPGGTLEERLADGALPAAETERIARGIAAGLAHLHAQGFVHRDLKPANVLFDDEERPKLADFGLARSAGGPGTLTEAGTVLGTAAYISPEQAAGEPATPASDVYSFGVMLFRMLTGALPFVADDALALVNMHRTEPAPAVEEVNPDAPPELAALTNSALQKDPAARPADGAAVLAALGVAPVAAAAMAADTEETRVLPAAAPAGRPRGRTIALAVALLLLAALGGILAWAVTRPPATAPAGVVSTDKHGHKHTVSTATTGSTTGSSTTGASTTAPTAPTTTAHTTTARTTTSTPTTTTQPTTTIPTTTTVPTTTMGGTTTTGVTT
jgi:eukaryotic-like serine/threonine-protein kinase